MKTIIFCASTLDGKIARSAKDPIDWTTKEDKRIFAEETKRAGVVIMGNNTYKAIGRPLPNRLNVVLSSSIEGKTNIMNSLEFTSESPDQVISNLERRGYPTVFVIGGSQINSLFLMFGLVNELWVTLSPKIFGQGIGLVEGVVPQMDLELLEERRLSEGHIFLKYRVLPLHRV